MLNLVSRETVAGQQRREHESLKSYGVGSRYQATIGEDTAAEVNCGVCELDTAL
jgi:hypothetical protein